MDIFRDASARAVWQKVGRPELPAVSVEGRVVSVLHPSQLGSVLGLDLDEDYDGPRLAWDLSRVLDDWVAVIEALDWETLRAPTPARGRSTCQLVANVFQPISLLPDAWARGQFPWPGDHEVQERIDARVAAEFADPASVVQYAKDHLSPFRDLVLRVFSEAAPGDPIVISPDRGELPFSTLLASQRWHAAFHLLQVVMFLDGIRHPRPPTPCFAAMQDLQLPDDPY